VELLQPAWRRSSARGRGSALRSTRRGRPGSAARSLRLSRAWIAGYRPELAESVAGATTRLRDERVLRAPTTVARRKKRRIPTGPASLRDRESASLVDALSAIRERDGERGASGHALGASLTAWTPIPERAGLGRRAFAPWRKALAAPRARCESTRRRPRGPECKRRRTRSGPPGSTPERLKDRPLSGDEVGDDTGRGRVAEISPDQ